MAARGAASPPLALRAALGVLDGEPGVEALSDWAWHDPWWAVRLRLSVAVPSRVWDVPEASEWYLVAQPEYPWGAVELYPAVGGGLTQTHWHQHPNRPLVGEAPWLGGLICTDTVLRAMGRHGHGPDVEPHTVVGRLQWRVRRARAWIAAAATGDLARDGEPFELPSFSPSLGFAVVSSEDSLSLTEWNDVVVESGAVRLARISAGSARVATYVTGTFRGLDGTELVAPRWGTFVTSHLERDDAHRLDVAWVRMPSVPVVLPYGTPCTWAELREAVGRAGADLDGLLAPLVPRLRGAKSGTPCLVGFPVPNRFGEGPGRMHWQPVALPALPKRVGTLPVGGRAHRAEEQKILSGSRPVSWGDAENASRDQIEQRGRVAPELAGRPVALLGAGALGSVVGELLVRAGVEGLVVVDPETFEVGNSRRHTLGLGDVGQPKATALADRLNAASPHARVEAVVGRYPEITDDELQRVHGCEVILDCTSSDAVLPHLETAEWGGPRLFVSLSLGYEARRAYAFVAEATGFPHERFREAIGPWLVDENAALSAAELPRQVGCWHPLFPARVDHVWLFASALVGLIEGAVCSVPATPKLVVLERAEGSFGVAVVREASRPDP